MINKYERIDPSRNIIFAVEDVNINAITQFNDNGTRREDMPMQKRHRLEIRISSYKRLAHVSLMIYWCVL